MWTLISRVFTARLPCMQEAVGGGTRLGCEGVYPRVTDRVECREPGRRSASNKDHRGATDEEGGESICGWHAGGSWFAPHTTPSAAHVCMMHP